MHAKFFLILATLAVVPAYAQKKGAKPKTQPLPRDTVAETLGLEKGETDLVAPSEKSSAPTDNRTEVESAATTTSSTSPAANPSPMAPVRAVSRPIISGPTAPKKPVSGRSMAEPAGPTPEPSYPSPVYVPPPNVEAMHPSAAGHQLPNIRVRNLTTEWGQRIDTAPRWGVAIGYIGTKWKDLSDGNLRNGSLSMEIGFAREVAAGIEGAISFEAFGLPTNSTSQEFTGGFTVNLETKFFPWREQSFRPFFDIGLALGAYRAWYVTSETDTEVTLRKAGNGILFGLQPGLGVRTDLGDRLTGDLRLGYHAFFDSPNYKLGGWNFAMGLAWSY